MAKYRNKPVEIEAVTFNEFVEYGKNNGGNIVNGMPWSFSYKGHPVTHENDELYLIPRPNRVLHFTPKDMLITDINGEIYSCKINIFEAAYEKVDNDKFKSSKVRKNGYNEPPTRPRPEAPKGARKD